MAEELTKAPGKLVRFVGGLFMEEKSGHWVVSIGRVSWWAAFIPALYIFVQTFRVGHGAASAVEDITPNHLTILIMLAGYNFGKKMVDSAKAILGSNIWGKNE